LTLQRRQTGSSGSNCSPSIDIRGPTAAAARTREAASTGGELQHLHQEPAQGRGARCCGQIGGFSVDDQAVVDQW
jgi:hypothetical protein